jgi:hypothetical protein
MIKINDGGVFFNEEKSTAEPVNDPLDGDWDLATNYYPDLLEIENKLANISWRLSYAYRAYLLSSKSFFKRQEIANGIEDSFLKTNFGNNNEILAFA